MHRMMHRSHVGDNRVIFVDRVAALLMYVAYDIRRPICDNDFFPSFHLCLVVYMYPTPICDIRCPICDSDFSALGGKISDDA